jgi:glutamate-1-semialdehyde 2,1-aminomutase
MRCIVKTYRERLHHVIPGGAHTYSRGDDQFPNNAPAILEKGEGAYVWDPDNRRYLDYGMGLRSVTLGYANERVNQAAYREMLKGINLPRASTIELQAAELLVDLIPAAEMVKFAKNGSNVTTAAIKIARAYTGKKYICLPRQHPFFSFDDWFIGSTPIKKGIPTEISQLTLHFDYNNLHSLEALFQEYPNQIAGVILEPATLEAPQENFLHGVKQLCEREGAIFILDEMITGFRWHLSGAQAYYDIEPDLSTFGKGMANGFPLAALVGKRELMELGSIQQQNQERLFLLSATHGGEMMSLGAFVETVKVYQEQNVIDHIWEFGKKLFDGINDISKSFKLQDYFKMVGHYPLMNYFTCDQNGLPSLAFRTLFSQEMIKQGILMPWVSVCLAHQERELEMTLQAVRNVMPIYAKALEEGIDRYIEGDVIKPVFRKHN